MRKILVAVDGSDNALRALDFAVKQAGYAPQAVLHVLNVQLPPSTYTAWEIYVSAETIRQDNQCNFGKWLYGTSLSATDKSSAHYRSVRELRLGHEILPLYPDVAAPDLRG